MSNEKTCSKKFKVDKNIAPVVDWLNSIEGVYTMYSCAGHPEDGDTDSYISFIISCMHQKPIDIYETILLKLKNVDVELLCFHFLSEPTKKVNDTNIVYNRLMTIRLPIMTARLAKRFKNV